MILLTNVRLILDVVPGLCVKRKCIAVVESAFVPMIALGVGPFREMEVVMLDHEQLAGATVVAIVQQVSNVILNTKLV